MYRQSYIVWCVMCIGIIIIVSQSVPGQRCCWLSWSGTQHSHHTQCSVVPWQASGQHGPVITRDTHNTDTDNIWSSGDNLGGVTMPGVITVPEFIRETREDYTSPTTSTFVNRIPQCRETINKIDEVRIIKSEWVGVESREIQIISGLVPVSRSSA